MQVTELKPKSNKLKDLQNYIAECSSVVRDKQPKSAEKLFNRLLKESIGDKASRVLEYIPCTIEAPTKGYGQQFGFYVDGLYYTNMRELLNWGWGLKGALQKVDFTHYKVFKCETPYFIYGQVSTHNQLTTVSHSQRYSECERGFWMPPELEEFLTDPRVRPTAQERWNSLVNTLRPQQLRDMMKDNGVVRKEVFDRGVDMLQNRVFTIGGYTNNPNAWQHFLLQRMDSHTQIETQEFANMLHDVIEG